MSPSDNVFLPNGIFLLLADSVSELCQSLVRVPAVAQLQQLQRQRQASQRGGQRAREGDRCQPRGYWLEGMCMRQTS